MRIAGGQLTREMPMERLGTIELDSKMLGASTDDVLDRQSDYQRINVAIANAERPTNQYYRVAEQSNFWMMYTLMNWYRREVSVLSTICSRATTELFRHGLGFEPKFNKKCEECGYEAQTEVSKCPSCGSARLRRPDWTQQAYFIRPNGRSFLKEANDNGQTLKEVLRSYAESQYLNNQAYILCVTGDLIDSDSGRLQRAYPLEFIAEAPEYVMSLFDRTGKPGTTYGFTRDNRQSKINIDTDEEKIYQLAQDGKEIYPAYWQIGESPGGAGQYWLYTQEEVYQDHWFRPSLTYGIPIWFDIEDDLLAYHYLEKHFLSRYKFGYVRKIVILPGFSEQDAESMAKGVQDVLSTNTNSIPIICTPPQIPGTAEMKAQTLELGTDDASQALQAKDDIRDRLCAHGGVPNLFAGDVEASGGMNNESQQITIFDRYLMDKYEFIDSLCDWIMSWFPNITDWNLRVNRPSKAYTDAKRRMDKLQEAQMMKSLGFDIFNVDGDIRYSEEPIDQVERRKQEAMQAAQAAQQPIADGGMMPGDGDGPPEKGTARREDEEIGDAKDEVDLSKREADGSMD
mgnify:FL=1